MNELKKKFNMSPYPFPLVWGDPGALQPADGPQQVDDLFFSRFPLHEVHAWKHLHAVIRDTVEPVCYRRRVIWEDDLQTIPHLHHSGHLRIRQQGVSVPEERQEMLPICNLGCKKKYKNSQYVLLSTVLVIAIRLLITIPIHTWHFTFH